MKNFYFAVIFLLFAAISAAATEITVGGYNNSTWRFGGDSAKIRIYLDRQTVTTDGKVLNASVPGLGGWYKQIDCAVSGSHLACPSFVLDSTTDSSNPNAKYTFVIFDSSNKNRDTFATLKIPPSPSPTTFGALLIYNQTAIPAIPETFTKAETTALISALTDASVRASENLIGSVRLDSAPDDSSNPVAVGINSPLLNASDRILVSKYDTFADAVGALSGTKSVLVIDDECTVSTAVEIPANMTIAETKNGRILKTGAGKIYFEGVGLENPTGEKLFSGFAPGDIVWTDEDYPREISAELFDSDSVTEKYNITDRALLAKSAVIHVLKGTITGQSVVTEQHTIKFGAGTFLNTAAVNYQFVLQSNTKLLGEGAGITNIRESDKDGVIRIAYASGVIAFPFHDKNYNIEVRGIRFYSDTDKLVDTSASAVNLGNITRGVIADNEFDGTHGFGAYVGGFADAENTGVSNYAENCWITGNTFKNLGAQNAGVIQGKNIFITDNIFTNFGQERLRVNDGVADGGNVMTSATGGFTPNMVGASVTVYKEGVYAGTLTIASTTNNSVTLYGSVPAGTGYFMQVRTPFLAVIDLEPNHQNDILENIVVARNIIDARGSVATANGIVSQRGGGKSSRNIQIKDNLIIGGDMPATLDADSARVVTLGIILEGAETSDVSGNTIIGTAQSGMSIANTSNSTILNNKLVRTGGGGNPAIEVIGSRNNLFGQNILTAVGSGSQANHIQELEYSGVINVAAAVGGKSNVALVSGQYFIPGNVGGKIRFGGASYVITDFVDFNNIKISRTGGALSNQDYVSNYNSNMYRAMPSDTVLLSADSGSKIINEFPVPTLQPVANLLPNTATTVGNNAGAFTYLHIYSLYPVSALGTDGTSLEFIYTGKFSNSASTNKKIFFDISGGQNFDSGNITSTADWTMKVSFTRNAGGSEKIVAVELLISGLPPIIKVFNYTLDEVTPTSLSIAASGTLANDVILKSAIVRRINWQ